MGKKDDIVVPDTSGMTTRARQEILDNLLAKALEKNISFEPNKAAIEAGGMDVVRSIGQVLTKFPDIDIRCEGHAKGKPADNNAAKIKLSQVRAESVRTALKEEGTTNVIECVGIGSAQGLGMCVRMYSVPSEPEQTVG